MRGGVVVTSGTVALAAALLLAEARPERLEVTGENVQSVYKSFDRLTAG